MTKEAAPAGKASKLIPGAVLAVLWIAMFLLPSAVIRQLGQPRWLALAVGLLAFPLLPLGWHFFAEWRRKKQEAPKTTLTKWDRLMLRTVAVAVLAIGGTIFLARSTAWKAVRHQALWFTSWTDPDPIGDHEFLRRVPADAEYVIWIRKGPSKALLPVALSGDVEGVIAVAGDQTLIMFSGAPEVLDSIDSVAKLGINGDRLLKVDSPKNQRIFATPAWRSGTGGSPLLALIRKAPADANLIAAARAERFTKEQVTSVVAWARVDDAVYFGAEAEAVDEKAAEKVIEKARLRFDELALSKDCGNKAFANAVERKLVRDGKKIRGSAELSIGDAREISRCMMSIK